MTAASSAPASASFPARLISDLIHVLALSGAPEVTPVISKSGGMGSQPIHTRAHDVWPLFHQPHPS